ncbi:hypothetical protein JYT16_01365 [Gemmatimonas aurantiaca]|nr:hypothetical protein [Gemmatimonas aurantiaca]
MSLSFTSKRLRGDRFSPPGGRVNASVWAPIMKTQPESHITKRVRLVLALASFAMLSVFVLPLWSIDLLAPQYPEGLGIYIEINTIVGHKKHDLKNLNMLNHYIGMQEIVPDSIPELKIMPYIFGALIAFGFFVSWSGRRKLFWVWVGAFALVAIGGMVDFYIWSYDYGHNLDLENAAIQVPGASYQPPLLGSKKILNFTAVSWPALGGWIAILSYCMVIISYYAERRLRRCSK